MGKPKKVCKKCGHLLVNHIPKGREYKDCGNCRECDENEAIYS